MRTYERPTSEWEHSHALEPGMELTDQYAISIDVEAVNEDGSVDVFVREENGNEYHEQWTEEEARVALTDGVVETVDGLSHELATF